jgi:hypothetical protein
MSSRYNNMLVVSRKNAVEESVAPDGTLVEIQCNE